MSKSDNREMRLARSVERRMRDHVPVPSKLSRELFRLAVVWLQALPARIEPDTAGRMRLGGAAVAELERLGRTVGWMLDSEMHHGEQASELAQKALRGVLRRRITFEELLGVATQFRAVRHRHIRQNARRLPRAKPATLTLAKSGLVATRIVTEASLSHVGHIFANCLGVSGVGDDYARQLRQNTLEFWRIDTDQCADGSGALMLISLDRDFCLDELDHRDGMPGIVQWREAILAFLAAHWAMSEATPKVAGTCSHAIRDRLGRYREMLQPVAPDAAIGSVVGGFRGEAWEYQAGPGILGARRLTVLSADSEGSSEDLVIWSWVLRDVNAMREEGSYGLLSWTASVADEELDREPDTVVTAATMQRYRYEAEVRSALRRACHSDVRLAELCHRAFNRSGAFFREDWFGIPLAMPVGVHREPLRTRPADGG